MDLKELKLKEELNTGRHPWELARLEVCFRLLQDHIENLQERPLHILDMGCGDTFFIEELSRRLPKATFTAIDIAFSDEQVAELRKKYTNSPISVFRNLDDPETQTALKQVDIVLLLDVIEHVRDDISFMQWLGQFGQITPQTQFLITVPAFQKLFCAHDVFLAHYRRYSNAMLETHLEMAGYRVSHIGYFFTSLLFPRILQVFFEKLTQRKSADAQGIGAWKPGKLDQLMKTILVNDFKLTYSMRKLFAVPGLSNYAICAKSVS